MSRSVFCATVLYETFVYICLKMYYYLLSKLYLELMGASVLGINNEFATAVCFICSESDEEIDSKVACGQASEESV